MATSSTRSFTAHTYTTTPCTFEPYLPKNCTTWVSLCIPWTNNPFSPLTLRYLLGLSLHTLDEQSILSLALGSLPDLTVKDRTTWLLHVTPAAAKFALAVYTHLKPQLHKTQRLHHLPSSLTPVAAKFALAVYTHLTP